MDIVQIHKAHSRWLDPHNNKPRGRRAKFRGSLVFAKLNNAVWRNADFRGCDLRGADFRGCDLRGADFRGCDLRGAKLQGAELQGADFSHALLFGVRR
jgi:uncharacterized protein YjbI with pentapeptide repeats